MNPQNLSERYLQLLIEKNKTINLTRIDSFEEGKLLHIEDSCVGLNDVNDAPEGRLVDIGSGSGFPGVPLAFFTGRETLLVDSVKKKMAAVLSILQEMNQGESIQTFAGRAEELALKQPSGFSVVTARALSSLPALLELAAPLLCMNGRLICYKSDEIEDELAHACSTQQKLGMRFLSNRAIVLSDGVTRRRIVVFEKVSEPSVSLPRRPGMAQKRPYK